MMDLINYKKKNFDSKKKIEIKERKYSPMINNKYNHLRKFLRNKFKLL